MRDEERPGGSVGHVPWQLRVDSQLSSGSPLPERQPGDVRGARGAPEPWPAARVSPSTCTSRRILTMSKSV